MATFSVILFYFGWPALVAVELSKAFPSKVSIRPGLLLSAGLIILAFFIAGYPLHYWYAVNTAAEHSSEHVPLIILGILASVSMLYLLWVGGSALAQADAGQPASTFRKIIGFLLFFYLPIGIIFTQMRLRRLPKPVA